MPNSEWAGRGRRMFMMCVLCLAGGVGPVFAESSGGIMRIAIIHNNERVIATLADTPAAARFADMLPLTLTLSDYAATEKVADLPAALPTHGSPRGMDPDVGDITYYAPWGNLAIFYKDFGYANGLISLGRIDGDIAFLKRQGSLAVRFEALKAE